MKNQLVVLFLSLWLMNCSDSSENSQNQQTTPDTISASDVLTHDGQSDINTGQEDLMTGDDFTNDIINTDQTQVNDLGDDWLTQNEVADVQADQLIEDFSSDQCFFVGLVTPCYLNELDPVCDPDFTIFKINETARFKIDLLDVSKCASGTINAKIDWGDGAQQEWVDGDNLTLLYTFNTVGTKTVEIEFYHNDMFNNSVLFELELIAETDNIQPVAVACDDELKNQYGVCVYELNIWPPTQFDFTDSFDPDGKIVKYCFRGWCVSDGEFFAAWEEVGVYDEELVVTDNEGVETSVKVIVIVSSEDNQPPVAVACDNSLRNDEGVCVYHLEVDVPINFDFSDSYDPDGEIVKYKFANSTKTKSTFFQGWEPAGTYNETLEVTDDKGATCKDYLLIIVN